VNLATCDWMITEGVVRVEGEVLQRLFMSAFAGTEKPSDAHREVLETLIRTTLDYRDLTLSAKGRIVTVRDVRASLAWLIPCLATGNIPKIEDPVHLGLLERWLEALKNPLLGARTNRPD
jgi:hypothetical protein